MSRRGWLCSRPALWLGEAWSAGQSQGLEHATVLGQCLLSPAGPRKLLGVDKAGLQALIADARRVRACAVLCRGQLRCSAQAVGLRGVPPISTPTLSLPSQLT